MREVRRDQRDRVRGSGELTWDEGRTSRRVFVEVSDISDGGIGVIAPNPLPVGIRAFLTGEQFRCIGIVRHCNSNGRRFRVGIEFNREPHHKNGVAP